ncbi:hypothetical protein Q4511_00395 [Paracoccus sp. 1_MG-2023]|uniref:hypothetical protein n=1 Tax=unclassified Paracoccus (in: a-proteobacteria) TaxID=2688777 RepID=UPI001C097ED9|nr:MULTISPECIES: hypothetical protein [unclassified Paracoccus (in: a-proteobacteria)]MBU2957784.1 hypothetical protein [Paracoccus sp. C2R09]MDO6667368.1 hypothetical protein [Paracoccus sp. 1_MG-2023]
MAQEFPLASCLGQRAELAKKIMECFSIDARNIAMPDRMSVFAPGMSQIGKTATGRRLS